MMWTRKSDKQTLHWQSRGQKQNRNKQHNLTAILTDQNSSNIEKRSCQLYASRTKELRPQMCSSSTEQSRAAAGSYFCTPKTAGLVRHFEIGVQCAFENLAWPRHFTNQRLPTQHSPGGPMSFNQSNLVLSGGLKLKKNYLTTQKTHTFSVQYIFI